ncbi:MAG: calcium-binding protein, partial [Vampirovibrionales bacterium]
NDALFGEAGNDTLYGDAGNDDLWGGEGDDLLGGGEGNDRLFGGAGNDLLFGDNGDDRLWGGIGDDTLYAGEGTDLLFGGAGNDFLYASETGTSYLYGQEGRDYLESSGQGDYLDGGEHNDILYATAVSDPYGYKLDTFVGGKDQDVLFLGSTLDGATGRVRAWFNDGDGNDVISAYTYNFDQTYLVEASAAYASVTLNVGSTFNSAFTFKSLVSGGYEVTAHYGTGINTLRFAENGDTDYGIDLVQVNSTSNGSFFFNGRDIRNIYDSFVQYSVAQGGTVDITNAAVVRGNTDLMNIIASNAQAGVAVA